MKGSRNRRKAAVRLARIHARVASVRADALHKADRVYQCGNCGLVMDRDVNAARNLLSLAASGAERLNACGAAVRPGLTAGRAVLKQEPGTRKRDNTGTAATQAAAE